MEKSAATGWAEEEAIAATDWEEEEGMGWEKNEPPEPLLFGQAQQAFEQL